MAFTCKQVPRAMATSLCFPAQHGVVAGSELRVDLADARDAPGAAILSCAARPFHIIRLSLVTRSTRPRSLTLSRVVRPGWLIGART